MIVVPLVPPTVLSTHQDPLSHAAKAFHDALPPKDFLALKTQLQHYCQRLDGKPLRVGTMFSGCDVAVKALDAIQEHWSEVGMELQFHHLFACEIEEWKQEFILHHLNPQFESRTPSSWHATIGSGRTPSARNTSRCRTSICSSLASNATRSPR